MEHPYFGTELVLADLARQRGFEEGRVELLHGWTRDPATGLVKGIAWATSMRARDTEPGASRRRVD